MTNEEQKAYHAKQEQERLNNCKIKTLEQFLDECKKADIDMDWFSFTCDRSKPVSMDDDTVYYGKSGKTIVAYDFQRKSFIVFTFTKRTDKRDAETFGFTEGSYLCGSYRYPVPHDLRARIMSERDFKFRLSEELRKTLTERLAKNLIEDEFNDLRALQEAKRNALDAAFDPRLSAEDQKKAFARASNSAEVGNPAADNYADSRCHIISHNILRHAYERAGLDR